MNMRYLLLVVSVVVMLASCGRRGQSAAELQQKIDSVRALETVEQLKKQGIVLGDANPLQLFYDSLAIQTLPLDYSEDYVKMLPNYTTVPDYIFSGLELEGKEAPKAIALPDMLGMRLMLLAADVADGQYELWLYSLDDDYMPVDKLQLYEPSKFSEATLQERNHATYFSITSDVEIRVMEYADDKDEEGQLTNYMVDDSRMFVEKESFIGSIQK